MQNTKMADIKRHLLKYRKITSWEAIQKYQHTRLADAIFKLRNHGWPIKTHRVDFVDSYGNKGSYALYTIPNDWSEKDLQS